MQGQVRTSKDLTKAKKDLAQTLHLDRMPKNSEILTYAEEDEYDIVLPILQKKPTRTISGVAIIAAMTKPSECPHGKCLYCPGGLDTEVPQSYTGKEPAARRAAMHDYDPYEQVNARLHQLSDIGHPVDKCELIIMGGTLPAQEKDYQDYFVKGCLHAFNDFPGQKTEEASLKELQKTNEKAKARCIGMTFETRPDYCRMEQIKSMLDYGATKVEIGVQVPDDNIYKKYDRGHTVKDVIDSTRECKDSLLKVAYHLMPGLAETKKQDLKLLKSVFEKPEFRPDMIKIYPCLVIKGTKLYEWWEEGKYHPYSTEDATELIAKFKKSIPEYARVIRVQRDIPSNLVDAGVVKSNLRQLVEKKLEEHGEKCRCIRCREIGLKMMKEGIKPDESAIELVRRDYEASEGKEIFLSFEDKTNDAIIGFLRLRKPGTGEIEAGIRELHVYGAQIGINKDSRPKTQDRNGGGETQMLETQDRKLKTEMAAPRLWKGASHRGGAHSERRMGREETVRDIRNRCERVLQEIQV